MIPRPGCNFRIFQKSSKYIDLMHIRHQKSNETGEKDGQTKLGVCGSDENQV